MVKTRMKRPFAVPRLEFGDHLLKNDQAISSVDGHSSKDGVPG